MWFYLLIVSLIVLKSSYVVAAQECGKIKLNQLYNENPNIALDESPWIGQILVKEKIDKKTEMRFISTGILISKRHLLTPAHNFLPGLVVPNVVVLGGSNTTVNGTDCEKQKCAPPPKQYNIRDVAFHPLYYIANDIAVVRLLEDVEFSDFIQPICLPSVEMHTSNYLAQYLIYTGYKRKSYETDEIHKFKTVVHIVPQQFCLTQHDDHLLTSSIICASYVGQYSFFSGSAIIGVNIVDTDIKNYYLIGMAISISLPSDKSIDLFLRISSYINWIESNMN